MSSDPVPWQNVERAPIPFRELPAPPPLQELDAELIATWVKPFYEIRVTDERFLERLRAIESMRARLAREDRQAADFLASQRPRSSF